MATPAKAPIPTTTRRRRVTATDPRICPLCKGYLLENETLWDCPCRRNDFSVPSKFGGAGEGSLNAAHFYALYKKLDNSDWIQGRKAPHNPRRDQIKSLYRQFNEGGHGFSIYSGPASQVFNIGNVEMFILRCAVHAKYNRNEWAGLMAQRMILFLAGHTLDAVKDYLQIPRSALKELDEQIREYVKFPYRIKGDILG